MAKKNNNQSKEHSKKKPVDKKGNKKAHENSSSEVITPKTSLLKKIIPYLVAFGTFLLISLIYCSPIFSGKRLQPLDQTSANAFTADLEKYDSIASIEPIMWSNAQFSGMPASKYNAQFSFKYIGNLLYFEDSLLNMNSYSFSIIFSLMFCSFFLFTFFTKNKITASLMAMALALTSFNMIGIEVGHTTKVLAISYMTLALAGFLRVLHKRYWSGALLYTFGIVAGLYTGHVQIVYYAILSFLLLAIIKGIKLLLDKDYKEILRLTIFLLILTGTSFLGNYRILNLYHTAEETMRGGKKVLVDEGGSANTGLSKDYAFSWSYGINESLTYIVPNFMGGGSQNYYVQERNSNSYKAIVRNAPQDLNTYAQRTNAYWGAQPFVLGATYYGAFIGSFFIFYLLYGKKDVIKIWIISSAILFFIMSVGRNISSINYFLFDNLPFLNKFRTPSMAQSFFQIALYIGAFLGINELIENYKKINLNQILFSFGPIILVTLGIFLMPSMFGDFISEKDLSSPNWLQDALFHDRTSTASKDALRSLGIVLTALTLLILLIKEVIKTKVFAVILGIILLLDLWSVDKRWFNEEDFTVPYKALEETTTKTPIDEYILQDPDPHYRVFNLTGDPFQESKTSIFHKSIGGYHPAKLSRYQELIEMYLSKRNQQVLNMLNTKYIIFNGQDNQPQVQKNEDANGHAWFVNEMIVVDSEREEFMSMDNATFNSRTQAIINRKEYDFDISQHDPNSNIYLTKYLPHKLDYISNSTTGAFAVFPEIYYQQRDGDGWKATLDGEPVQIKKTNYLLRGIYIPAGQHKIHMEIDAGKVLLRSKIGKVTQLLLLPIFGLFFFLYRKNNNLLKF